MGFVCIHGERKDDCRMCAEVRAEDAQIALARPMVNDQEPGAGLHAWRNPKSGRSWTSAPHRNLSIEDEACIEAALVREAEFDDGSTSPRIANYVQAQVNAMVAAAYETAGDRVQVIMEDDGACGRDAPAEIRSLTSADARAALDAMLTEAREVGRMEVRRQMGGFQGTEIGAIDVIVARQRAKAMKVGVAEERKRCARIADQQCRACSTAASIRASSVGSRGETGGNDGPSGSSTAQASTPRDRADFDEDDNPLDVMLAQARAEGITAGYELACTKIENHCCVSSCCDAQPSGGEAKELARCLRRNAPTGT